MAARSALLSLSVCLSLTAAVWRLHGRLVSPRLASRRLAAGVVMSCYVERAFCPRMLFPLLRCPLETRKHV